MRNSGKCALLALFVCGCTATGDRVEFARAPIIGGTPAAVGEYPTVVAVMVDGWGCTGTLVAPDLVLTAAHCVDPELIAGSSTQSEVTAVTEVVLDSEDIYNYSLGRAITAADTIPNPQWGGVEDLGHDDIALVRLSQSVTDRTPTPINRIAANAPIGVSATLVGYGMTDADCAWFECDDSRGHLYVLDGENSISCSIMPPGRDDDSLQLCFDQSDGAGSCNGDSGGPVFVHVGGKLVVAGVIASVTDQDCSIGYGGHTRVDAELDFLDAQAPELACQADGLCTEECGQNGLPDDPDCPICETADDCDNPNQQECIDGFCFARPNTPGGLGYECVDNADCDSGLCGSDGVGHLCSDHCDPAALDCPDGFDCLSAADTGACWPSAGNSGGGGCGIAGTGSTLPGVVLIGLLLFVIGGRRVKMASVDYDDCQ